MGVGHLGRPAGGRLVALVERMRDRDGLWLGDAGAGGVGGRAGCPREAEVRAEPGGGAVERRWDVEASQNEHVFPR